MPIRRSPNGARHVRPLSQSPGTGGRDQSERLVAISWNRWSQSPGARSGRRAAEKITLWDSWLRRDPLKAIGRAFG